VEIKVVQRVEEEARLSVDKVERRVSIRTRQPGRLWLFILHPALHRLFVTAARAVGS